MKRVVLDFDGVVHEYSSGWRGADQIPDPPVDGAFDAMRAYLLAGWTVAIFSARSHQPGGVEAMMAWFAEHGALDLVGQLEFPKHKPPAKLYIDDRGHCFDGMWPAPRELEEFQPWHKDGYPLYGPEWYQRNAVRTLNANLSPEHSMACLVGKLGGEVGELQEAVFKALYHKVGPGAAPDISTVHEIRDHIEEELGDVLWYVAAIADALGLALWDIMVSNVDKLRTRYPDGFTPEDSEARVDNPFLSGTEIEMMPLKSSNLEAIGVLTEEQSRALGCGGTSIVQVRFKGGAVYRYREAESGGRAVLAAAERGDSSGRAFHAFLRAHPRHLTAKLVEGQFVALAEQP